jgi:hypothetical protein
VLSPAAVVSQEVRGELRTALDLRKRIVPVLHEPCEIPRQLKLIERLDFTSSGPGYEANLERLCPWIITGILPPNPESERLKFIDELQRVPDNARAFDKTFTKTIALALSKKLSDKQFDALHDLRVHHNRYGHGARGIVRSLAINRIGEPSWEATQIFDILMQLGFLALSADPRERNHADPSYDYTPLFWGYTNLMRYCGIGQLKADQSPLGAENWLSPKDAPTT